MSRYFQAIRLASRVRLLGGVFFATLVAIPASASSLTIVPTFDSTITSDPNAAVIEATINSAIQVYDSLFSNPITVSIEFTEMSSGLSQNVKPLDSISYSTFYSAYSTNAADNNDPAAQTALASGVVPNQTTNPVTGSNFMYASTADLLVLGIPCGGCTLSDGYDGIISFNAGIINPGNSGPLEYYLMPSVEHEIDEVLGLGSSLGQTYQTEYPSVEDLFRYASNGARSYTTDPSALAYFSINGTSDLAQFDNQNDGGDWGDWQSNPLPQGLQAQVQDAFSTPGANPSLGVNEITALEAAGYDLVAPEPGTTGLLALGFGTLGVFTYRRRRSIIRHSC